MAVKEAEELAAGAEEAERAAGADARTATEFLGYLEEEHDDALAWL